MYTVYPVLLPPLPGLLLTRFSHEIRIVVRTITIIVICMYIYICMYAAYNVRNVCIERERERKMYMYKIYPVQLPRLPVLLTTRVSYEGGIVIRTITITIICIYVYIFIYSYLCIQYIIFVKYIYRERQRERRETERCIYMYTMYPVPLTLCM